MGIPVDELTQRLGSNHVAFYRASYELHPPVGDLLDWISAIIPTIALKGNVADFLPRRYEDAEPIDEARAFADRMAGLAAMRSQVGQVTQENG